jgi:class 3 adenylate cyclase
MEPERRQVTVLFADTVSFASFSERVGEEATFTLMRSLSKLMDEAVREPGACQLATSLHEPASTQFVIVGSMKDEAHYQRGGLWRAIRVDRLWSPRVIELAH